MNFGESNRVLAQMTGWGVLLLSFQCLCSRGGDEFARNAEAWRIANGLSWADGRAILKRHGYPLALGLRSLVGFPFHLLPVYSRN